MKKLQFSIEINAPSDKVWRVLWGEATYGLWTSAFGEGSRADSDWNEGSRVKFLAESGDGMFSQIEKMIPDQYMSFHHLGMIKNGKEEPFDGETKNWAGSHENYTLNEHNGKTKLNVDIDVVEEHLEYFGDTFPKALNKVKALSETRDN